MGRACITFREVEPEALPPPTPIYFDRDSSLLRLDQNTNPRPNPAVTLGGGIARRAELNRYGTARGSHLRAALSNFYRLPPKKIMVGNGSDEILDTASRAYLGPGRVGAMLRPGYDLYAYFTLRQRARLREVFLLDDLSLPDPSTWADGIDLLFLASPHSPTGRPLSPKELEEVAGRVRGLVIVDEAYAEYTKQDFWRLGERLGNVLFTRTFSKAWGLAGLRVGYGVGPVRLIERLECFRIPFSLDTFAEELAVEALKDRRFLAQSVADVRRERPRLASALVRRGFRVFPSETNFIYAYPPREGQALWERLREKGILIRRVGGTPACPLPLRITVGSAKENRRLLVALDQILDVPERKR